MAISKEQAKEEIQRIINKYEKLKSEGKIKQYNEEATKQGFILPLFHALGWEVEDTEEVYPESKVSKGRVDYSFKLSGITKFFLEAKKLSENLDDSRWSSQAISYAWHKGVAWSVLCDFEGLKVFNAEYKVDNPVLFDLTYDKYLSNFEQLWLLSKDSFLNKSIDLEAEKWKKKPKREKIDKALFEDLTKWRNSLLSSIRKSDSSITEEQADEAIQRIIDRLIFIRVCEDRELEDPRLLATAREDRGTTLKQLRQLFAYYRHKYDTKLFDEHLADQVKIDDNILIQIINDLTGSKEAFIKYDFNAINADVLGIIYEQYLGYILKKVGKGIKATKGKAHRKEMGIYYTPTYIVDYIVKNTIREYCKDKTLEQISNIKILDPACGSGSFLIKAFDELSTIIKERIKRGEKTKLFNELTPDGELFLGQKIQIACRNIYGVDLDSKAVEIAQLSILLKLLENEGKDHKGSKLLQTILNIKCGNSLIDDPAIAGDKAFKWEEQFDYVFKEGGFDIIIGNPPYVTLRGKERVSVTQEELNFYKQQFKTAEYKLNTFVLFIEKSLKLLKDSNYLGFIIPDRILGNQFFQKIRKLILTNCRINSIVDLKGAVFEEVVADTIILILQKETDAKKRMANKIKIINQIVNLPNKEYNLFTLPQETYESDKENLFRIDIPIGLASLFERIEKHTISLGKMFKVYVGIVTGDNKKFISNKKLNDKYKPILIGRDIFRYGYSFNERYVLFDKNLLWSNTDETVFEAPEKILLRKTGINVIACLDAHKHYTEQTIYNLIPKDKNINLKYILCILNSKLMNFYYRKKLITNIKSFPYIKGIHIEKFPLKQDITQDDNFVKLADKMLFLNKRLNEIGDKKTDERARIEAEIKKTDAEIDALVYKLYGLTPEEIKIIEESLK